MIYAYDWTQDADCEGAYLLDVDNDTQPDESPNENDATRNGGLSYNANGVFNGCQYGDSDKDQYLTTPITLAADAAWTALVWINMDAYGDFDRIIFCSNNGDFFL